MVVTHDDKQDAHLSKGEIRVGNLPCAQLANPYPWHEAAASFVFAQRPLCSLRPLCVFTAVSIQMESFFPFHTKALYGPANKSI